MKVKKLNKDTLATLRSAVLKLDLAVNRAHEYHRSQSEQWRRDCGDSYLAWMKSLEAAAGALDRLPSEPDIPAPVAARERGLL